MHTEIPLITGQQPKGTVLVVMRTYALKFI